MAARLANEYARAVLDVRTRALRAAVDTAVVDLQARLASGQRVSTIPVLEQRLNELEGLRSTGDPSISLAQLAVPPTSEAGPPEALVMLIALVVGASLAAASALLVTRIGPGFVLSGEDIARLPVLAEVPHLAKRRQHPTARDPILDPRLLAVFRALHVHLKLVRPPPKTVMITSPSKGDGRTTTALNLAVVLAEGGAEVIIADLHHDKTDLSHLLDVLKQSGSGTDRKPERPADQIMGVPLVPTTLHRSLRFLDLRTVVGRTSADRASRVAEVVARAATSTEFVILDTPPLSDVTEAVALAGEMGAVLVVARVRHTTRSGVEEAQRLLKRAHCEPTGCLLIG